MNKKAFTLVELIVVITILAILGTIAFIYLQGYSSTARNSRRISDINNIKKSLELFSLNTGIYPNPDNGDEISYSGELVRTQGNIGDKVTTNLSKNLPKKLLDPILEIEYIYSITNSNKQYQVLSFFEGDLSSNNIIDKSQAKSNYIPKLEGTYNEIFVKTPSYIIPTPSIINVELENGGGVLNSNNIKSQMITSGNNFPKNIGNSQYKTGALDITFNPTGIINKDSSKEEKENVINKIQQTYSGSILKDEDIYANILNTTDKENLADILILSSGNPTNSNINNNGGSEEINGWMLIDSNCIIPDIHIPNGCIEGESGCQIWAGCNSTLGTGLEWGQTDGDLEGDLEKNTYSGTLGGCYDYNGNNTEDCTFGSDYMLGNSKEYNWNSSYGVNNIWGKFYTGIEVMSGSICPDGREIPSKQDFELLETNLNSGTNCRNSTNGWLCDGLGWKLNNEKNNTNNIIKALKIPLSGFRYSDGVKYFNRGAVTGLWTSSENSSSELFGRYFSWDYSTVRLYYRSKLYGFNVRCIKITN